MTGPTVEPYKIDTTGYKIVIEGNIFRVSEETANELYDQLGQALNKPPQMRYKGCGDRFSHSPHAWGKDGLNYCMGRSFDAT